MCSMDEADALSSLARTPLDNEDLRWPRHTFPRWHDENLWGNRAPGTEAEAAVEKEREDSRARYVNLCRGQVALYEALVRDRQCAKLERMNEKGRGSNES